MLLLLLNHRGRVFVVDFVFLGAAATKPKHFVSLFSFFTFQMREHSQCICLFPLRYVVGVCHRNRLDENLVSVASRRGLAYLDEEAGQQEERSENNHAECARQHSVFQGLHHLGRETGVTVILRKAHSQQAMIA